jgi:hypothetical protein
MATMNDVGHVEYMGYIIPLSIYCVLGNTIQYRSMSYGVIQYAPLDNTIIFREVHIANDGITGYRHTGLQSTPLNPLAEAVEWMDLDPRCPSV